MNSEPDVSVVMSVYNSADSLAATLDSILTQEGVELEFILIDDGSTDGSGEILDDYAARDPRMRVVHQENTGLTKALIGGCSMARGRYIARQDAGGDISMPGRLRRQVELLDARPDVVMTACATQFVGPEGEELYKVLQEDFELQRALLANRGADLYGPSHHGAVMMRRTAYLQVGGYRKIFDVAQDLDLWTRLAERGDCVATGDLSYVAVLNPRSISAFRRKAQQASANAIFKLCAARRRGDDEERVIRAKESDLRQPLTMSTSFAERQTVAAFHHFVGSNLRRRDPQRACYYYKKALENQSFRPRTWLRYVGTKYRCVNCLLDLLALQLEFLQFAGNKVKGTSYGYRQRDQPQPNEWPRRR